MRVIELFAVAVLSQLSFHSCTHQPRLPAQNIHNVWKLDGLALQFLAYFQHVPEAGISVFLC